MAVIPMPLRIVAHPAGIEGEARSGDDDQNRLGFAKVAAVERGSVASIE
jgi:hypothetical protein